MTQPPYRDFLRQEYRHADINTVGRILKKHLLNVGLNYTTETMLGFVEHRHERKLKLLDETEITGAELANLCQNITPKYQGFFDALFDTSDPDLEFLVPKSIINLKKKFAGGVFRDLGKEHIVKTMAGLGNQIFGIKQRYRFNMDHYDLFGGNYDERRTYTDIYIYDRDTLDSLIGNISDANTEVRALVPKYEKLSQTRNMVAHVLDKIARRDEGLISQNPFDDI